MKNKAKKRSLTLFEVMIVIFIIGIIGSVVGYNMRGSLDQGKAFKTKEAISKVYNIVQMEMSSKEIDELAGSDSDAIRGKVTEVLKSSGFVSKPDHLVEDGWKEPLVFTVEKHGGENEIRMSSNRYEKFYQKKNKNAEYPWEKDDSH